MRSLEVRVKKLRASMDPMEIFSSEFSSSEESFLLESSDVRRGFSRFSFAGDSSGPMKEVLSYCVRTKLINICTASGSRVERVNSVFDFLRERLLERAVEKPSELPFDFNLGYVGFLGYELKSEAGAAELHQASTPDASFLFATRCIAVDHLQNCSYLLYLCGDEASERWGENWSRQVELKLSKKPEEKPSQVDDTKPVPHLSISQTEDWLKRNAVIRHSKEIYLDLIAQALEEITNGETYELCLTNMISLPFSGSPKSLYQIMRKRSPSPHGGFLAFGELSILSSSPERFLSISRTGEVEAKPIKGTRPRAESALLDAQFSRELGMNEKDRSENLMIVDLLRNDLNRVCKVGSVHVPALFHVETYSHVHQLVSTIRGQLKDGVSAVECVQAAFPGGSMTGAPKKRTMELIDRLEGGARGVYSGAMGWFSLCGASDLNIVIRTIVLNKGRASFGVGGAIVALSDPTEEYTETIVKARGLIEAICTVTGKTA